MKHYNQLKSQLQLRNHMQMPYDVQTTRRITNIKSHATPVTRITNVTNEPQTILMK